VKRISIIRLAMGVSALCCWDSTLFPSMSLQSPGAAPPSQQSSSNPTERIKFTLERISDGLVEDKKTWWKTFTLIASNGHRLDLTSIPFSTVKDSDKYLQHSAKSASKIIRRGPELNANDEVVGERVLGEFSSVKSDRTAQNPSDYLLFWTNGRNYWQVSGDYLDDVVALEDRLRQEDTNAVWEWLPK
jgi:hypothetical protein